MNVDFESWEQFNLLLTEMEKCIDCMFRAIDENNVKNFTINLYTWLNYRKMIYNNPYNDCGYKLCNEIMDFANKNNINI